MLNFFKALADSTRLKIVGLLAQQEYTVEQLADILGLGASTVSHHLSRLAQAGLVSARAESYYNYYRLERGALEGAAQHLLSEEVLRAAVAADIQKAGQGKEDAYAQKVLRNYFLPDGRLKTIPSQRKKLVVVLRFMAQDFEPGVRYSERTVNQMLGRYHADTASLRREMIGFRILEREKGEYWRAEEPPGSGQDREVAALRGTQGRQSPKNGDSQ
jgi:hypothetical protein